MNDDRPVTPMANDDDAAAEPGDVGDAALRQQSPGAPETGEPSGKQRQSDIDAVRKAAERGRKPI